MFWKVWLCTYLKYLIGFTSNTVYLSLITVDYCTVLGSSAILDTLNILVVNVLVLSLWRHGQLIVRCTADIYKSFYKSAERVYFGIGKSRFSLLYASNFCSQLNIFFRWWHALLLLAGRLKNKQKTNLFSNLLRIRKDIYILLCAVQDWARNEKILFLFVIN